MARSWQIQMPSFGQPGRTDRHPENAGGLLVIASRSDVGVGQLGQHDWIAPAGLLRALSMDGFGLDQAMKRPRFRGRMGAHDALTAFRVEAVEGVPEGVAAELGAKALHVSRSGQLHWLANEARQEGWRD